MEPNEFRELSVGLRTEEDHRKSISKPSDELSLLLERAREEVVDARLTQANETIQKIFSHKELTKELRQLVRFISIFLTGDPKNGNVNLERAAHLLHCASTGTGKFDFRYRNSKEIERDIERISEKRKNNKSEERGLDKAAKLKSKKMFSEAQ